MHQLYTVRITKVRVAILCVLIVGAGIFAGLNYKKNLYDDLDEYGEAVLNRVSMTVSESIWQHNDEQVAILIGSEMSHKDISEILISKRIHNKAVPSVGLTKNENQIYATLDYPQEAYRVLRGPIVKGAQLVGEVQIFLSDQRIKKQIMAVFYIISCAVLFMVGLVIMLARIWKQLIIASEMAKIGSKAKGDFLAKMSHEIRTPMNGVIGMTLLALDREKDPVQQENLETIKNSAETLLAILNDILDMSKIEAGKVALSPEPFDLHSCLHNTFSLIQATAHKKGLEIAEAMHDIPRFVIGDEHRFKQILMNLLSNAVKFTPNRGGIILQAFVEKRYEGGVIDIHCVISDSGPGIAADKVNYIFEPFSQAEISTAKKYGGTGLGLTICKQLAALMGGRIWVKSRVKVGSAFHFVVRFQTATEQQLLLNEQSSHLSLDVRDTKNISHLNVLLVEDNPVNQKVAQGMLAKLGHTVTISNNGKEALDTLSEKSFDIVLMDIQMPVMDGLEATRHIRGSSKPYHNIPILALTAEVFETELRRLTSSGMDGTDSCYVEGK